MDEDVHAVLSSILQKRGFNVTHAQELARKGISDSEQLEYAFNQKRCLFTFNAKDYVQLHNKYVEDNLEHYGIIVSKQLPIGETLKRILTIIHKYSQGSIKNRLLFLPK